MVICVYACANCMQNARFKPMHVIEAKLCRHLAFQMSFRSIQQQKSYHIFLGDRSELWPSIHLLLIVLPVLLLNHIAYMFSGRTYKIL